MGRRPSGVIDLPPGCCWKMGLPYRRFQIRNEETGKYRDHYVRLPHPFDPGFAEALERVNASAKTGTREVLLPGSMAALAREFRAALNKGWTRKTRKKGAKPLADSTKANYLYYIAMFEVAPYTKRLVKDLEPKYVYKFRDDMAEQPGKANNALAVLKLMLHFAAERGWVKTNAAADVPYLPIGEHDPWPREVLMQALAEASPMLRLAIVTGLCTGQRVSDVILIQHGWLRTGIMEMSQLKTNVDVAVPVHPMWREEIAKVERKSITLLYDRFGKPFSGTDRIQERIRRLMHQLGHVGEDGHVLYTFHGLRKNACCYLLETGMSDTDVGAILGMTPETVRHYGKRARAYMIAVGAAEKMTTGNILNAIR